MQISFTSIDFKKVLPVWTDCKLSPIDFVLHIQRYQQENNWINHRLNYAGIQKLIIQYWQFLPSNTIVRWLRNPIARCKTTAKTLVTATVHNSREIEFLSSPLWCPHALPPLFVKLYSLSSPEKYEYWYSINWQQFEKKSLSECMSFIGK